MKLSRRTTWRLTITGWVLFTISAVFFCTAAFEDGSLIDRLASLAFLAGCFFFIVPEIMNRPGRDD